MLVDERVASCLRVASGFLFFFEFWLKLPDYALRRISTGDRGVTRSNIRSGSNKCNIAQGGIGVQNGAIHRFALGKIDGPGK